jgi:peptidoglycan/LPS O-acetylase OafA/YrhL
MRKIEASTLGKIAIVVGTALIMFAVSGASIVTYPQYSVYYYSAGAGITTIIGGLILAVRIENAKRGGDKAC